MEGRRLGGGAVQQSTAAGQEPHARAADRGSLAQALPLSDPEHPSSPEPARPGARSTITAAMQAMQGGPQQSYGLAPPVYFSIDVECVATGTGGATWLVGGLVAVQGGCAHPHVLPLADTPLRRPQLAFGGADQPGGAFAAGGGSQLCRAGEGRPERRTPPWAGRGGELAGWQPRCPASCLSFAARVQDQYENVLVNAYVKPEQPVVSYLTPLTGCAPASTPCCRARRRCGRTPPNPSVCLPTTPNPVAAG